MRGEKGERLKQGGFNRRMGFNLIRGLIHDPPGRGE